MKCAEIIQMINQQRVSPRVLALDLRSKYTNEPFTKTEFDLVICTLNKLESVVPNAAYRLMDDAVRLALDELIEQM